MHVKQLVCQHVEDSSEGAEETVAKANEGMKFVVGDFITKAQEVGFIFRKDIIWHKPRGTTKWQRGATQFTQNPYPLFYNTNINHEFIIIFSKGEIDNSIRKNEKKFSKIFTRKKL